VLPKNFDEVKSLLDTFQEVTEYYEEYKFMPNGYQVERTEVLQVYVSRPGDVPRIRDALISHPAVQEIFEADIIYATARFFTNYNIFGMGWVEVDGNDIKPLNNVIENAPLRYIGLDIEVQPPEVGVPVAKNGDPITIMSLSFNMDFEGTRSLVLVGKPGKDTKDVKYYPDESSLLLAFIDYFNRFDPDVVATYNGHMFDFPYIADRSEALNVPLKIGRDGSTLQVKEFGSQKEANMVGRASIDLMDAIKLNYSLSSYSLENVSKTLLNRPKLDVKASEMRRIWLEGSEQELHDFVSYAARDADLLQDIISELKLIDRYIAISKECGLLLHESINGGQSRRIESMLLRGFFEEGRLFPLKDKRGSKKEIDVVEGGKVFDPEPGLYKEGLVMDYKSLYPSVIRAYNICWTSIVNEENVNVKTILAPNNVRYVDHSVYEGIMPRILTKLYNNRVELKTAMKSAKTEEERKFLDDKQYAVKILLNSFYGYTGAVLSRLYDPRLANSVTSAGRQAITLTKETAESLVNCKVVGGDTDSIFIHLLDGKTPEDGQKAAKIIHDAMMEKLPPPMEIDFECAVKSMLLLKKKHYAMWIMEPSKDGWKDKMKYRGIELRRRDWVPLVGETMEKVLELILKENKVQEAWQYTNDIVTRVSSLQDIRDDPELAEKLILSRKIGNINSYKNIQPHVTVYKKMESRKETLPGLGDRIQYYALPGASSAKYGGISQCVDTPEFVRNTDGRIDNNWYVTHQIVPPLERIFECIGISIQTGKKLEKESSLFEFSETDDQKPKTVLTPKQTKTGLFAFT
jgi:DNA polymerase I